MDNWLKAVIATVVLYVVMQLLLNALGLDFDGFPVFIVGRDFFFSIKSKA